MGGRDHAGLLVSAAGGPTISDVTFRVSQGGEMIGIDFECTDGRTRSVALPAASLAKIIAGLLWAGAESAERRPTPPLPLAERDILHDGARMITDWRVTPAPGGGDAILEIESGAGLVCVRVPMIAARLMGLALKQAAGDLQ
jgi:hypothetical protein